jgi:hypothetical protein
VAKNAVEKSGMDARKYVFYALLFWVSFWLENHVLALSTVGGR